MLGQTHGIEPALVQSYNSENKLLLIVKVAEGGTSVRNDWSLNGFLTLELIRFINLAKTWLNNNGYNPTWKWYRNQWD